MQFITVPRSVIPACDMDVDTYELMLKGIVEFQKDQPKEEWKVQAVKIGIALALGHVSFKTIVEMARYRGLEVIYDHQKAGTDIHEVTPQIFMDRMVSAGVTAVILFPQSGPVVQYEWTKAAQERHLKVIMGTSMTHPRYLEGDVSNGKKEHQNYDEIFNTLGTGPHDGYLRKGHSVRIIEIAAKMGVDHFVMPGNKPDLIRSYRAIARRCGVDPKVFSPGLIAQGGDIKEGGKACEDDDFHSIVGRGAREKAGENLTVDDVVRNLGSLTSQL